MPRTEAATPTSNRELAIAALHSVGLSWFDADQIIAAIEAEARAAVLRELREEVAGMGHQHLQWPPIDGAWIDVLNRAAVLAAIDRRLGDGSL